ncbi:hypothetical protein DFA_06308 [Cavenderia fasciculata]|uniref:Uncharacterized protein n=1 Tax=Cavenderia fasciculata TaxID=261658 RepID=F4PKN8_CACFS|nr:uncharacterized protein DFA_06308 [Cavenderia fasciculata]EGG24162.1 hypothetical protein DFA_06308 [Cavenderia fasciculata]|eukprot:XP_004362013.1 hypothetical protein DFA_06308 [Cavenderia fasciculata]
MEIQYVTATRFKLNTFKDILENKRADKSKITTALLTNNQQPAWASTLQSLCDDIPSIDTLFMNGQNAFSDYPMDVVDLGSIERLPHLERLSVYGVNQVKLGQHTTLKSMKLHVGTSCTRSDLGLTRFVSLTELSLKNHFVSSIGPDQLPISLTLLTIRLNKTPPRDSFRSLKSLVKLKIILRRQGDSETTAIIDLEHLPNLETFKLTDYLMGRKCGIEIRVPPSIKIVAIPSNGVQIQSQCVMPLLETLDVHGDVLIDGGVSLKSSPFLKKLVIHGCVNSIPANIMPSTVEKVTVYCYAKGVDIFKNVVFPPSLTHLTVSGECSVFRLDEVINHTNVRDFSISFTTTPTYQFSIQRLDKDNKNVLVLEKQTMTGGIITQRLKSTNNQQQQDDQQKTQYRPIYLHFCPLL